MIGTRRLMLAAFEAAKLIPGRGASLSSGTWNGYYPQPGPWDIQRSFVAGIVSPDGVVTGYNWEWVPYSGTGGAQMTLVSGQGTPTALWKASCPGGTFGGAGEQYGGGELTGEIRCTLADDTGTVIATVFVALGFGLIP